MTSKYLVDVLVKGKKLMIKLVTLHLTLRTILRTFASQNAPLYLALTSVPTAK